MMLENRLKYLIDTLYVLIKESKLIGMCVFAPRLGLIKPRADADKLYTGNPAVPVKELNTDAGYFVRSRGFVD